MPRDVTPAWTYLPSGPDTAELTLRQEVVGGDTALFIRGDGWTGVDTVSLVLLDPARSLGQAYAYGYYAAIGDVDVTNGAFESSLTIRDEICFHNGDCSAVTSGRELAVAATIRITDRDTSSVVEPFVIGEHHQ